MANQKPTVDPFSQERLRLITGRFQKGCGEIDRSAALARLGFLCSQFTDVDLIALSRSGLLTFRDQKDLVVQGRLPANETPKMFRKNRRSPQLPQATVIDLHGKK